MIAHRGCFQQTHGLSRTPEHKTWVRLRHRCYAGSKYYHDRGISVCERWQKFENFLADMGKRPSPLHSIERLDVNGDYCPENCVWGTPVIQANNKTNNRKFPYCGEMLTIPAIARKAGTDPVLIKERVRRGWDINAAISQPKRVYVRTGLRSVKTQQKDQ